MRTKTEEQNILHVQMFGKFSMVWKNNMLIGNAKSGETQFAYLMQMLLHNRKEGVSRGKMEQILFWNRDVTDVHHAMRTVIYNAKKKLKKAGLPNVNYIEQREGTYFWTEQIPVVEDAWEFEKLYEQAERETDPEQSLRLYLEACYIYTGEFLGDQTSTIWAAQEARRYREIFCNCVEEAVSLCRGSQNYLQMEELGLYAAKLYPLADWETITMEALIFQGRHADALKLYEDTIELYFREQGLHPSKRLLELFDTLGMQIQYGHAGLDSIQMKLMESENGIGGGYVCSYPIFQGIYQVVERMMDRGGQSVYLMLCTVVGSKGNPMKDGVMLEELSQRLCGAIRRSVRRSDVVTRYGSGQYLILLINTTLENCGIIQKRINGSFVVGRQRTGISYHVNSVICRACEEGIGTWESLSGI